MDSIICSIKHNIKRVFHWPEVRPQGDPGCPEPAPPQEYYSVNQHALEDLQEVVKSLKELSPRRAKRGCCP